MADPRQSKRLNWRAWKFQWVKSLQKYVFRRDSSSSFTNSSLNSTDCANWSHWRDRSMFRGCNYRKTRTQRPREISTVLCEARRDCSERESEYDCNLSKNRVSPYLARFPRQIERVLYNFCSISSRRYTHLGLAMGLAA